MGMAQIQVADLPEGQRPSAHHEDSADTFWAKLLRREQRGNFSLIGASKYSQLLLKLTTSENLLMRSFHPFVAALLAISFICVAAHGQNISTTDFPLFAFDADGLYGYTDARGAIVIKPQFHLAWDFSEGLARVDVCTDDGLRWGFIDRTGTLVITASFEEASDFSDGLAAVEIGGAWGFIDHSGKVVIKPEYYNDDVLPEYKFSEGFAAVNVGKRWGYINKAGKMVITPKFDGAEPFQEGMAEIEVKNKRGYVDTSGRIAIKPQYDLAAEFSEGLARVNVGYRLGQNNLDPRRREGLWGYVDKTGGFVISPQFNFAASFSEGRARVRTEKGTGFIDKTGGLVIADKYEDADDFSEGLAAVRLDKMWGYIDPSGRTIIPFKFGEAQKFTDGIAPVNNWNNRIDKQGELVWTRPLSSPGVASSVYCEPKSTPAGPTPEENAARRRELHKLMLKGLYEHDGAAELLYIGDMTSVPSLLRVLKDNPPTGIYNGRRMYICTHAHAVAALTRITGEKFEGYLEWSAWWTEYRRSHAKE
jgi:predicted DNA-binding WGR domain protein